MALKLSLAAIILVSGVWAQKRPEFEVASIKPSRPGQIGATFYSPTPDRFEFDNTPIKGLIAYAYGVPVFQVAGASDWLNTDRYDIVAKPEGAVSDDRLREMVQSLLAERLRLKVHEEQKEMPVFALMVAKNGPKLTKSATSDQPTTRVGYDRFSGQHLTMENLIGLLAGKLERPVVDKTGIEGQFDIKLEWIPEDLPVAGPSIFTAVQQQLGLKLEYQHAPQEVVVIDHVERPSEN